jgi:alpha-L-fucosidase 2
MDLAFAQKNVVVCMLVVGAMVAEQGSWASAWKDGRMQVGVAGVVGRSDIVLEQPNLSNNEALPLGNGRLGAAVWSQDGFTAQLNRGDTMPRRLSPGQIYIPGLATLTGAADYRARLNLYDGTFEEQGGGMRLKAYVQPDADMLVIEVTGADPGKVQAAVLHLWEPRKPTVSAHGAVAMLAESWVDNEEPGASGRRFGSLAAMTAEGRDVSASVTNAMSVTISFRPMGDGHFRIFVEAPGYKGETKGALQALVAGTLAHRAAAAHVAWWNRFWQGADWFKVTSKDGSGEYMENLRALYLYSAAAESGGEFPGSQAGEADLFSGAKDERQWDPAAFWHWNLRMQVAANLGAGLPELNQPYFRLYRENLDHIEAWTREHMRGAAGICIPETMRFNGNGIEFERWGGNTNTVSGWNCDAGSARYYNARTMTTGAEVSLWIWE